jgi:hypothetical protein
LNHHFMGDESSIPKWPPVRQIRSSGKIDNPPRQRVYFRHGMRGIVTRRGIIRIGNQLASIL